MTYLGIYDILQLSALFSENLQLHATGLIWNCIFTISILDISTKLFIVKNYIKTHNILIMIVSYIYILHSNHKMKYVNDTIYIHNLQCTLHNYI